MSESNLPAIPSSVMEKVTANFPTIMKGTELGTKLLKEIQSKPIESDEDRTTAVEKMTKVKAIFDKIDLMTSEVVTPLEEFVERIKSYKKSIDPNNKNKDGNEYTRARSMVEIYDQAKLKDAEKKKAEAELIRRMNVLKAEIKKGVGKRLVDMLAGQKKNIIDGMSRWEGALTIENLDVSFQKLVSQKPSLKVDKWEACFSPDFMSMNRTAMTADATALYLEGLKKEFPYEEFNAAYVETVAPIINEYRAKQEQIRAKLTQIAAAGEAEKLKLEEARKAELEVAAAAARKEVDAIAAEAHEAVEHTKEMDKMDAEFTAQAQTQDLDEGPKKKVAAFEDNKKFLKPFTEVIGQCVMHEKFPGIMKKNGVDVIDSVQWWLDWYAAHGPQPIKGVVVTEEAKTIIRKV